MPSAPGLLSITTGWPSDCDMRGRDDPRDDVGRAAGAEGDDRAQRLRRVLGLREQGKGEKRCEQEFFHKRGQIIILP